MELSSLGGTVLKLVRERVQNALTIKSRRSRSCVRVEMDGASIIWLTLEIGFVTLIAINK